MIMGNYKEYIYFAYPDLSFVKNCHVDRSNDLSSVFKTLTEGLTIMKDIDFYGGQVLYSAIFEYYKPEEVLKVFSDKYKSNYYFFKKYKQNESVPVYLIKMPLNYLGIKTEDDINTIPLPIFKKYNNLGFNVSGFSQPKTNNYYVDSTLEYGYTRLPKELIYSVYYPPVGYIENPAWTPFYDLLGLTFNRLQYSKLLEINEKRILDFHLKAESFDKIKEYELSRNGEIFDNIKNETFFEYYHNKFSKDIQQNDAPKDIKFEDLLNKFLGDYDPTTNLEPIK